jgi:hypothetical protein
MIVFLGVFVGGLVFAMSLPIFTRGAAIGRWGGGFKRRRRAPRVPCR